MNSVSLPEPLQILVVEDHTLYVEGLRMALSSASFSVDLTAQPSVEKAQSWLLQNAPHLTLLDLHLPDGTGWELLRWINQLSTPIPCVVITSSDHQTDLNRALEKGARGFINKGVDSAELIRAIETVMSGNVYTPEPGRLSLSGREQAMQDGVTPRQYDVLLLLAQGCPNKVICQKLGLTGDTVKTHLKALFNHFGVHNRTECVAKAVKQRLIELESSQAIS